MLDYFEGCMNIVDIGKWLQKGGLFGTILLILNSFIFQGCSQQITGASFVQKTTNSDEVRIEGAFPEQPSPFASMNTIGLDRYVPLVKKYAQQYKIDWILVLAMMKQESRFNHEAISFKGAYGLMQIMPLTQIELAEKLGVEETTTPRNNIKAGIYHLKSLYEVFEAVREEDRTCLSLAAYNAGLGRVLDAQKVASYMGNDPYRWSSVREALPFLTKKNYTLHSRIWSDGYPPSGYFRNPKQTMEYVDNIMASYDRYSLALK
jgi:membrane-bound lytic murein transglycosylase MltF